MLIQIFVLMCVIYCILLGKKISESQCWEIRVSTDAPYLISVGRPVYLWMIHTLSSWGDKCICG